MGKKSIRIEKIVDNKTRRIALKKRRIGVLKKAMQLSILTECQIHMKIWSPEDKSLLVYSNMEDLLIDHNSKQVQSYVNFSD